MRPPPARHTRPWIRTGSLGLRRREAITGVLFALPAMLGFLLWWLGPMAAPAVISLTDWQILTPPHWTGLDNYIGTISPSHPLQGLIHDPLFWQSLRVTATYAALSVPLSLATSFCIALALTREPRFAPALRRIVIMGGMIQRRFDQLATPYLEHNIRCDPEAAQIVLASGAPITLVPLDVTTQVRVHRHALPRIAAVDKLGALVADQLDRYMTHKGRDWTYLHDPLTAATVARPDFVRTFPMQVAVETRGDLTRGETVALQPRTLDPEQHTIDVALEVETAAFELWLADTLARPVTATGQPA